MKESYFYLIGGLLAVAYTISTSKRKDYKELGLSLVLIMGIFLILTNWFGLIISIAADIVSIKDKLKDLKEGK